jgi:low affinity Fe/Cu permease
MTPRDVSDLQVAIESQNEDEIRKLIKQVQDIARDNLIDVYNTFIGSL